MPEGYNPDYNFENKFSGKAIDEEFEREEELDGGEEVAADLRQAHEDVMRDLPNNLNEKISDMIETTEIHYNGDDEDWTAFVEDLTAFLEGASGVDPEEAEEEFGQDIADLQKESLRLVNKKSH